MDCFYFYSIYPSSSCIEIYDVVSFLGGFKQTQMRITRVDNDKILQDYKFFRMYRRQLKTMFPVQCRLNLHRILGRSTSARSMYGLLYGTALAHDLKTTYSLFTSFSPWWHHFTFLKTDFRISQKCHYSYFVHFLTEIS